MALLEKQLVIKRSTIPGSGKGLFTKALIPKGTRIIEYTGRITTWKEVENDHTNAYIYTVNSRHVIDARNHLKSLARYINDARGLTKIKGITNNCTYVNEKKRVFVEALRDIPAGSELFVSYGKEYWDVIRTNMKIDKIAKT